MTVENGNAEPEDAELYSWSITKADSQSLTIALSFTNPENFDKDQPTMYASVKASFSDFEPGWEDDAEIANVKIPI